MGKGDIEELASNSSGESQHHFRAYWGAALLQWLRIRGLQFSIRLLIDLLRTSCYCRREQKNQTRFIS